ncbi:MAG: Arm DNA-binding domain-containing protein [Sphingorhabdus sp.]
MALNDTLVRAAKPQEKDYKINDGRGLYLQVNKAGGTPEMRVGSWQEECTA